MLPYTYFTKTGVNYIEPLMKARVSVVSNSKIAVMERYDIKTLNAISKFPLFLNYRIY
jgi:hypothetical protein